MAIYFNIQICKRNSSSVWVWTAPDTNNCEDIVESLPEVAYEGVHWTNVLVDAWRLPTDIGEGCLITSTKYDNIARFRSEVARLRALALEEADATKDIHGYGGKRHLCKMIALLHAVDVIATEMWNTHDIQVVWY